MTAPAQPLAPLPGPPLPLSSEVSSSAAYRRASGESWEQVGAALRFDPDALRRAAEADPLFAARFEQAWAEEVRAAEAAALRRLRKLTDSEDERVALRASEVLVRYAVEGRRAEAKRPPTAPRTPTEPPNTRPASARGEKEAGGRAGASGTSPSARVAPLG